MPSTNIFLLLFFVKLITGLGLTLCGIAGASMGDPRAPVNIIYGVALLGLAFVMLIASIFDPTSKE